MPRGALTAERVVAEAGRLADEAGLENLTLAALAGELGVRTPSLYNHVGGLGDLRVRLARLALAELGRRLAAAAVGRAGDDAVRGIAVAYRAFAHEHPGWYAATVTAPEDPQSRDLAASVVATVVAALAAYGLDDDEAIHATRALRSALHGFVALETAGGFGLPTDVETSFDRLVDTMVSGLRASSSRR